MVMESSLSGSKSILPSIPSSMDLSSHTLMAESFVIAGLKNFDSSALPPVHETKYAGGCCCLQEEEQHIALIAVDAVQPCGSSCDLVALAW